MQTGSPPTRPSYPSMSASPPSREKEIKREGGRKKSFEPAAKERKSANEGTQRMETVRKG
jgi:hypothetical protein